MSHEHQHGSSPHDHSGGVSGHEAHVHGGCSHCHDHHHQAEPESGVQTVKDPVCGMTIDPATAKYRAEHGGKTYYFLLERLPREIHRRP